jgi:RND family efflux transporter MFP subunit
MMNLMIGRLAQGASAVILVASIAACGRHEAAVSASEPRLPTVPVRAATITASPHPMVEEVVGTVRARLRASIEAKVSGRVKEMHVVDGQPVQSGDLLATLDVREIQAQLDQALARREQAASDLKRFASLVEQGAVTRQEFDATQARSLVANAAVTQAEAMLDYARITAPFTGVVTRKLADVGDLAVPGKALVEIEDPTSLRLEANVPEALYGRLKVGQQMSVSIPAIERVLHGMVGEISPAVDAGSRTFVMKMDLPQDPALRSGLFGRVAVPVGESNLLRVPKEALVVRGQMEMVFVVKDGHAELRLVRSGKKDGEEVGILSGLSAGETVVIDGAATLRDGQPVELK